MFRTTTCGELTINNIGNEVVLAGWVAKSRDLGGMTFVDLRDRYGITQLVFNMETNAPLCEEARKLGREFVIQARGKVAERSNKNLKMPTGEIEILVDSFTVLNEAKTPPFTIEENTDGGDELRMKYRYLDLRRDVVRRNMELRHQLARETRNYLDGQNFIEVETPVLIKSTPEGARDFVVPSRMHTGEFYALPQSPQTFKQLLMVSGFDRYYQIVKCFRDEDLRADRQPEFTQIDCEMSFVEQEDILNTFEGMARHLFKTVKGVEVGEFPRMTYADAMRYYGSDKPDTRFDMKFVELKSSPTLRQAQDDSARGVMERSSNHNEGVDLVSTAGFVVFDTAELVVGINAKGCATYTRKQLDALTDFVKDPKRGMSGMIWGKMENGELKTTVDKFFTAEQKQEWVKAFGAEDGDLILILAGATEKTQKALGDLRLEMANQLGLRDKNKFSPLWVLDFPLLEWNEEEGRFFAMHHPFTSPKPEDIDLIDTNPGAVRANAYDMVINGVEIGGGSIRIFNKELQSRMFDLLGFTKEEAQEQFGFLMNAFEYGAPPHGGLAFGFDRLCSLFGGADSIRDFMAFPKNNAGRDTMIEAPSAINPKQLIELGLKIG
jgi:aspartyl-tRNA synthetase